MSVIDLRELSGVDAPARGGRPKAQSPAGARRAAPRSGAALIY